MENPKIKKSYGILCCRNRNGIQIVMVRKAITYYFSQFISGNYKKSEPNELIKLFNNMTYDEKIEILSMRFDMMWYKIYKQNPEKDYNALEISNYIKKKSRFENTFIGDGGKYLRKLIENSFNAEMDWEFPKGRKNDSETDINAATREFKEETGITEDKYMILFNIPPFIETFTDYGITYQNIFYFAKAIDDWEPSYNFLNDNQIKETSANSWISLNALMYLKLEKKSKERLIRKFKIISSIYKNAIRKKSIYQREQH
jgi:ADP-ribose pyrophosphatase YjhB (NUDIX family)